MLDALTKVFSWRRWTEDLHLWYQFGSTNIYASKKFRAPWHLAIFFSCFFHIYISSSLFFLHHDSVAISFRFPEIRGDLSELLRGLWLREVLFCHRCLCRVDQNSFDVIDVGGQLTWLCFRSFRNLLPNSKKNQIHKIDSSRFSRFSRFLGCFCLRPFLASRPQASFWRSVATRRRHPNGPNDPNDPNDPKPPFPKTFQYLPVISSQK